jgi:hypothetical protein
MTIGRSLRDRIAAQSAMAAVVASQAEARPRSFLARLVGRSPLSSRSRPDYRAALGELLVGDILENLGQRWDVLHDIPLGSSTLDHLVIGPAGVLAVRVVNARDRDVVVDEVLVVSGEATDELRQARVQAELAATHLSEAAGAPVDVVPLVVVVRPRKLVVRAGEGSIRLVTSAELDRFLHRLPRILSGDEVAGVSDLADLESTWPEPNPTTIDVALLHRAFALVREEVRVAFWRRIVWASAALLAAFALVWMLVARLVTLIVGS